MTNQIKNFIEEGEKEFDSKWNYASFCWNEDINTGRKFAQQTRKKVKKFISSRQISLIKMIVESFGESHNLDTEYKKGKSLNCALAGCNPLWDGNYYTCQFCGKEFIKKDTISSKLKELIKK